MTRPFRETHDTTQAWAAALHAEIEGNILPFWMERAADPRGGFYGLIHADGRIEANAPKAVIIQARALWAFAAAASALGERYRPAAERAFVDLCGKFRDGDLGGLFWMLNADGSVLDARKQIYAQAFGIYALAEYHRATGSGESLDFAKELYRLIEAHARDLVHGGYLEAFDRNWSERADMRLSEKDLNCAKSMNTHLHVLEAYAGLLQVWPDAALQADGRTLLELILDRIVDPHTAHFGLFFDRGWKALSDGVSFGHDIEGSWLLFEAAKTLGEDRLLERAREAALAMAEAVLHEGRDGDGSVFFAADGAGRVVDPGKHWWVQAEAVIGFYNAYELSGERRFAEAALCTWNYIAAYFVDRVHGEWRAKLARDGTPLDERQDPDAHLSGPWKCPYHNARLCIEMIGRLEKNGKTMQ